MIPVPFVHGVKWGLSFRQVSLQRDSQSFKASLSASGLFLVFLYDFVFSSNREMKTGPGSVNATKQSAQWGKSTAGLGYLWRLPWMHVPISLGLEKEKKKPLLYHLLDFFPFSAIINRYVTPDSPFMLVEVRENWFWAPWNCMGVGERRCFSCCLLWSSAILSSRWIFRCGLGNKL